MKNNTSSKNAETSLSFKKVLHGYDPEEVSAYIGELSRTMQEASKLYEMRMAEMKQELTLVNRERDNLRARCDELEKNIPAPAEETEPVIQPEDDSENQQEKLDELQRQLSEKSIAEASAGEQLKNAASQISELLVQLEDKEQELSSCFEKINLLEEQSAKQDSVRSQYEDALGCIESLKAQISELEEEKERLISDSQNAEEHYRKIFDEESRLKTELSRLGVENSLLAEKNEQYRAEISELKSEAKNKAYEFAEKLSAGEDELNREKIALQKKLQLQKYHIDQADAAVEELKKQLEQIRTAFSE